MSREITVSAGLNVRNGNLNYPSSPRQFTADMSAIGGPTPGTIDVSTTGTDIDLSGLTTPGMCFIHNLDATNYVQLGVWNPDQSEFYPIMRIKAGEHYVIRLDPDLNEEYAGTSTGTTGELNTLRLVAANAACKVRVDAFED